MGTSWRAGGGKGRVGGVKVEEEEGDAIGEEEVEEDAARRGGIGTIVEKKSGRMKGREGLRS